MGKVLTCGLTVSEEFTIKGESCEMCLIIMRVYNYVHNKCYVTYSGFQLNVVKSELNLSTWPITKDTENFGSKFK